jgi:glycerol-3-phosphate acyltransferase PlsY
MYRLFCVLIGYGIGCIQTAFIVGKLMGNLDIREHGSGNAGSTNVIRVLGWQAGALVFAGDVLKALAAYVLCALLFAGGGNFLNGANGLLPGLYAGVGVVLGHNFPFFLKFKGGKGIASSCGVILCTDWRVGLVDYVCALSAIFFTKYVSLASLIVTGLFPILLFLFGYPPEAWLLEVAMAGLAYFQHRGNILRLLKGTERKFSIGGKSNEK